MKKTLSILMTILIIALSFTFVASAACECREHKASPANSCHCCIDCDNFDEHWASSCVKKTDAEGKIVIDKESRCCIHCTGLLDCSCGCECCVAGDGNNSSAPGQILTPEQQDQVVDTFQNVLGRIREFFDKLFDAIFEFLRFDEIMGNN